MKNNYTIGPYFLFVLVLGTSGLLLESCATNEVVVAQSDLSSMNLKGDIKSLKEYSFEAVEIAGKLKSGRRKTESTSSFDNFDKVIFFNEEGNIIEEERYRSDDKLVGKQVFKYDPNGDKIEVNRYGTDGEINLKVVPNYDEKGIMVGENRYNSNGNLFIKASNKYDANQNLVEETSLTSTGSLFSRSAYTYDENKNIIETRLYDFKGELEKRTTFEFDDSGNVVEENNYKPEGSLAGKRTYTYEFDNAGNWTRKVIFLNERPAYIIEREIEYLEL